MVDEEGGEGLPESAPEEVVRILRGREKKKRGRLRDWPDADADVRHM